jgi:hypothetical protein
MPFPVTSLNVIFAASSLFLVETSSLKKSFHHRNNQQGWIWRVGNFGSTVTLVGHTLL